MIRSCRDASFKKVSIFSRNSLYPTLLSFSSSSICLIFWMFWCCTVMTCFLCCSTLTRRFLRSSSICISTPTLAFSISLRLLSASAFSFSSISSSSLSWEVRKLRAYLASAFISAMYLRVRLERSGTSATLWPLWFTATQEEHTKNWHACSSQYRCNGRRCFTQ